MPTNPQGAIGAIFAAIVALMTSIVGLLRTADRGVAMLDEAVADAQVRQKVRSKVDMDDYAQQYVMQAARRQHEARLAIRAYTNRSEEHAEEYQEIYNRLLTKANEGLKQLHQEGKPELSQDA